jgi:peroxiredoxin
MRRIGMAEVPSTFMLKPGDEAPEFALPDPAGAEHPLADLAGSDGTLVVFACNHCPYVIHLADALGSFAREAGQRGVNTVAINSNDVANYPDDAPEKMITFAQSHGWDFPYLIDEDQQVAKAYGAACTPDFFLFDARRRLFYAGQFDKTRPRGGQSPSGDDLRQALDAMLAGDPPPAGQVPSTGCNIKWKAGNAPEWF